MAPVRLLPPSELERILPDDDTVFMDGFACPREPVQVADRVRNENIVVNDVVRYDRVKELLEMVAGALAVKTLAIERLQHEFNFQNHQLDLEKEALAKAMQEEQHVEDDSRFLREEMDKLLKERQDMQESIAQLCRENCYLVEERELVLQQIQQLPDGAFNAVDTTQAVSLTSAMATRADHEQRLRNELQIALEQRERDMRQLREELEILKQQNTYIESEYKEKETALIRCLETTTRAHFALIQSIRQPAKAGAMGQDQKSTEPAAEACHKDTPWAEASASPRSSSVMEEASMELDEFENYQMASYFGSLAPRDSVSEMDVMHCLPGTLVAPRDHIDDVVSAGSDKSSTEELDCMALTA